LTTRRLRFGQLLGLLGLEQLLLHLLFHAATASTACTTALMPGHAMSGAVLCAADQTTATGGWAMLVGHGIAVAATAWLLARGEQWLWRSIDRVHHDATAAPARVRRARQVAVAVCRQPVGLVCWITAGPRAPPVA
jgi:hypothetical protein